MQEVDWAVLIVISTSFQSLVFYLSLLAQCHINTLTLSKKDKVHNSMPVRLNWIGNNFLVFFIKASNYTVYRERMNQSFRIVVTVRSPGLGKNCVKKIERRDVKMKLMLLKPGIILSW